MRNKTIYRNGNSKSANAESAEQDGRYPITTAAKHLGISLPLLKKAIDHCGYTSTEWHHVSKYANRVDYYDVNELLADYRFIHYLMSHSRNKEVFTAAFKSLASERMNDRLEKFTRTRKEVKSNFESSIKRRCAAFNIPFDAFFKALPKDQSLQDKDKSNRFNTRDIVNGSYEQEDIKIGHFGNIYSTGTSTIANVKRVLPFELTLENMRNVFLEQRKVKSKWYYSFDKFQKEYKYIMNKSWLIAGIKNLKSGLSFTNNNSGQGMSSASHTCKRLIESSFYQLKTNKL